MNGKREKLDIKEEQGVQRKLFMKSQQSLVAEKKHQKMYIDRLNIQRKKEE